MTKNDRREYKRLVNQARLGLRVLKINRHFWKNDKKARQLNAINANIWLAIGILRHTESYNQHGVRI